MDEDNNEAKNLGNSPDTSAVNDVSDFLQNLDTNEIFEKIAADPANITKILGSVMDNFTPEMLEQAKGLAGTADGNKIFEQMIAKGESLRQNQDSTHNQRNKSNRPRTHDTTAMRTHLANKYKNMSKEMHGMERKALLLTQSRQLKIRTLPPFNIESSAKRILRSDSVIELNCSRLALGSLYGKNISVWYDPDFKGKNKRASLILGFPVAGEFLFVLEDGNLLEKDFVEAEKLLQ